MLKFNRIITISDQVLVSDDVGPLKRGHVYNVDRHNIDTIHANPTKFQRFQLHENPSEKE